MTPYRSVFYIGLVWQIPLLSFMILVCLTVQFSDKKRDYPHCTGEVTCPRSQVRIQVLPSSRSSAFPAGAWTGIWTPLQPSTGTSSWIKQGNKIQTQTLFSVRARDGAPEGSTATRESFPRLKGQSWSTSSHCSHPTHVQVCNFGKFLVSRKSLDF